MAAYTDLTAEQQAQLQAFANIWRSHIGMIYSEFQKIENIESSWNASVSAMVTALDANTLIPNTSGLAGAGGVTRETMIASLTDFATALASYNDPHHRMFAALVAGPGNIG
jgi:hypothetical protein